ncbi:MAG: O-methyltransferase [Saprospiraceae bacterium]
MLDLTALHQYCTAHSSPQSDLLYRLDRETHLKTLAPQMSSGELQGRFLSLLSKLMRPQHILEIGTFTGYATLCLAEGLAPDGKISTIEVNPEIRHISQKYFTESDYAAQIDSYTGDAKTIIPTLATPFDLVFIDAGKNHNDLYYEMVLPLVKTGGLIITDNVLWRNKVVMGATDRDTQTIQAFNEKVNNDTRVENLLLPVRDGVLIARKL